MKKPLQTNEARVQKALDAFTIELPSWGFADTGTRFGKFYQDAAAVDIEDKFADAGQVHALTGCCPKVALHVLWDFAEWQDPRAVAALAKRYGVGIGAINPNLFQDQIYKYGSFANPEARVRKAALRHAIDSVEIAREVGSRYISMWMADGSNYPGQANIRDRKRAMQACFAEMHKHLAKNQTLLIEYKPFEPAFYHTDIADWGMAYLFAKNAGPQAKVLVDTGHHYTSQNIEQIVAWLLDENMLGGFHFNDRRYADDDLTLGSIDPYQAFRIFHEIQYHAFERKQGPIAYMIDQSHNDKSKIEATIQTVSMAQELYAKAALVDHGQLSQYQKQGDQVMSEELLRRAFFCDVQPMLAQWRADKGLPKDPLAAFRASGYEAAAAKARTIKRAEKGILREGSYA